MVRLGIRTVPIGGQPDHLVGLGGSKGQTSGLPRGSYRFLSNLSAWRTMFSQPQNVLKFSSHVIGLPQGGTGQALNKEVAAPWVSVVCKQSTLNYVWPLVIRILWPKYLHGFQIESVWFTKEIMNFIVPMSRNQIEANTWFPELPLPPDGQTP